MSKVFGQRKIPYGWEFLTIGIRGLAENSQTLRRKLTSTFVLAGTIQWCGAPQGKHDYQANVHEAPVDIARRYERRDHCEQSTKAVKEDKEWEGRGYDNGEDDEHGGRRFTKERVNGGTVCQMVDSSRDLGPRSITISQ